MLCDLAAKSLNLTFYSHEIRSPPNATVLSAVGTGAGNLSAAGWGTFIMADNPERVSEVPSSKQIGRSTSLGALTSSQGSGGGIFSISKITFNEAWAKYNKSTITFTGTFALPNRPYEIIVLGGTGYFRDARGFALAPPGLNTLPVYTTKWEVFLTK